MKKYLVPLSKHILVQENDFVRAGSPLCDGVITPRDILAIKGIKEVQEYIVNEVQEVYRLQGVKINDKHFEVVVRQMMRKVEVVDSGDTNLLEKQLGSWSGRFKSVDTDAPCPGAVYRAWLCDVDNCENWQPADITVTCPYHNCSFQNWDF